MMDILEEIILEDILGEIMVNKTNKNRKEFEVSYFPKKKLKYIMDTNKNDLSL